jgi:hypothetical protein
MYYCSLLLVSEKGRKSSNEENRQNVTIHPSFEGIRRAFLVPS